MSDLTRGDGPEDEHEMAMQAIAQNTAHARLVGDQVLRDLREMLREQAQLSQAMGLDALDVSDVVTPSPLRGTPCE